MNALDPNTVERLNHIYPDLRVRVIRVFNDMWDLHGVQMKCAQGLRTYADQQAIYEKGRSLVDGKWVPEHPADLDPKTGAAFPHGGIVTWSKPGDSWHHFSAVDSCFAGDDPWLERHPDGEKLWAEYARFGKSHGLIAGYDWPKPKQDKPHLEITYGLTLAEVKEIYAHGGIAGVWTKFDMIRSIQPGSEWNRIGAQSPALT